MGKLLLSAFFIAVMFGVLVFVGACFETVQASTEVIGIIDSDATWAKAHSPYTLTGPVRVNNGITLTVEAGTTVNFNGYYIQVDGTLHARGSSVDQINFNNGEIKFTDKSKSWNEQASSGSIIENAALNTFTIDINDTSPKINSNSIINGHIDGRLHASFTLSNNNIIGDGYYAVIVTGGFGSPVISNNTIICDNNHHIGISGGGNEIISNNIIKGGGEYGIKNGKYVSDNVISGFSVGIYTNIDTVERNLIVNNTRGIEEGMNGSVIRNNTIANNTVGIFSPKGLISFNNFENNTDYEMYLDIYATSDVNASFNWWGTTDAALISQSIFDSKNDFNLGTVTFEPFLTAPNPEAMPSSAPGSATPEVPEFLPWIIFAVALVATATLVTIFVFKRRAPSKPSA